MAYAPVSQADDIFRLSQAAIARRQANGPENAVDAYGSGLPGMDSFFEALKEKQEGAAARGQNFRVNPNGFGQDSTPMGQTSFSAALGAPAPYSGPTDIDPATAYALQRAALSRALNDNYAAKGAQDDANRGVMAQQADQSAFDRALSPARPVTQNADGSYVTGAQPAAPSRADILAALPGHLQPILQAHFDSQDATAQALKEAQAKTALTSAQAAATPIEAEAKMRAAQGAEPLSAGALDEAAQAYLKTGVMPTLGMKDPGNRQKIMNRAAEMSNGTADIAGNKAGYKADSGSLTGLQKQRDAVGAFEGTALKNMDMFVNAAGKIVDTGSPMMNIPARMVSGKMIGSPDQAAYEAARQVALTEIAKVTSNPGLSGQLSDSARHEVEGFSPANATLAQTVAIARTLKADMANRRTELDRQIGEVKGRISTGGGVAAPAGGSDAAAKAAALIQKYSK